MNYIKIKKRLQIRKNIYEIFLILLGSMLLASGTSFFLLPNKLSSGGFSGIATITYYLFQIPLGVTILLLNIPLFILAYIKIGKAFLKRSILGTVSLSIFVDLFDRFDAITTDHFLGCIYGGILVGLGTAIILKVNASTGGTDLLSYIVRVYKPSFRPGNLIVMVDIVIVTLNVLVFHQIEIGLYSAITIYIMGKMLDIVFEGVNFTKVLFIISKEYEAIAKEIGKQVSRGSTGLYAKGMYTDEEKMMLFCVGSRSETSRMKQIATAIDPKSFIVISNAREAFGKGFKRE